MPLITFKKLDGTRKTVDAKTGSTVMLTAQSNGIDIEGACEGCVICSTCHVIVDRDWFYKLEPASEEEEDLLDLAVGITSNSRLGCQIVITEALNGIEVTIPSDKINIAEG